MPLALMDLLSGWTLGLFHRWLAPSSCRKSKYQLLLLLLLPWCTAWVASRCSVCWATVWDRVRSFQNLLAYGQYFCLTSRPTKRPTKQSVWAVTEDSFRLSD